MRSRQLLQLFLTLRRGVRVDRKTVLLTSKGDKMNESRSLEHFYTA